MEISCVPWYKHSLHWKTILPDCQPYAIKRISVVAEQPAKKEKPIVLNNILVHRIPRLPILSLKQMILWSWSKSRTPTGWTKSLKLRNTQVELSSNHLKNRALSNCTSPPFRNAKKMIHGCERISWWICATFNFCMLNNLEHKWLRNEHCQGGQLHLLKNSCRK